MITDTVPKTSEDHKIGTFVRFETHVTAKHEEKLRFSQISLLQWIISSLFAFCLMSRVLEKVILQQPFNRCEQWLKTKVLGWKNISNPNTGIGFLTCLKTTHPENRQKKPKGFEWNCQTIDEKEF